MLAAVLGRTTAEVAVDADDAGTAGLLTRSSDGSFAFRHALVRQAVAARLTARRAADLHLSAARALEQWSRHRRPVGGCPPPHHGISRPYHRTRRGNRGLAPCSTTGCRDGCPC